LEWRTQIPNACCGYLAGEEVVAEIPNVSDGRRNLTDQVATAEI
jgi:hypothetical protein